MLVEMYSVDDVRGMPIYLNIASDLVAVFLKYLTLLRILVYESYEYNQEIVLFSIKLTSV